MPGANTKSYKELGDRNRGVLVGQYVTVLTRPIFYGINQPVDEMNSAHKNHAYFSSYLDKMHC